MKFTPIIYKNWHIDGIGRGRVDGQIELPSFDNMADAEKAMTTALDELYPTLWELSNADQYLHVRSQLGDHVLAFIEVKISDQERIDQEIAEINASIEELLKEREQLLAERRALESPQITKAS